MGVIVSDNEWFEVKGPRATLRVDVRPSAAKNEIVGVFNGRLKIKLCAPPVDGKANKELVQFFSKVCKLPKSSFEIAKGKAARQKTILCPSGVIQLISDCFE